MKNISILIILIVALNSVSCKEESFYANIEEISVINEMNCWDSYEKLLLEVEHNKKESRKTAIEKEIQEVREQDMTVGERYAYMDTWMPYLEESEKKGKESLYNNIDIINLIRNDSLLKPLEESRKMLSESLEPFKSKVPFFYGDLIYIGERTTDYKYYYQGNWGFSYQDNSNSFLRLSQFAYNNIYCTEIPKFYSSLGDILKDKYSLLENSDVEEKDILTLHEILVSIDSIDKKLWLVKEYKNTKLRIDETQKDWQLNDKHKQRVDSLFRN